MARSSDMHTSSVRVPLSAVCYTVPWLVDIGLLEEERKLEHLQRWIHLLALQMFIFMHVLKVT